MTKSKRRISIRFKMFVQITSILLLAVILILIVNTIFLDDIYLLNEERKLKEAATYLDSLDLSSGVYIGSVSRYEEENNLSIDVYGSDGTPLYLSTTGVTLVTGNTTIIETETDSSGGIFETREIEGNQYISYQKTLSNGTDVEIVSYKSTINANAGIALIFTWISVVLIYLIAIIFIFFYIQRFTKPLIKMSKVTEKMTDMDFSEKLDVKSNDEIGALSEGINNLSNSLDITLNDLNEKNEQLRIDIEKKQTLDDLRKEFISSISHELKTPIAIIRGYAEGAQFMLESDDTKGAKEYCDIILMESDKMNGLVFELLELSKYEIGDDRLLVNDFSLKDLIHDYIAGEKIVFSEKGINYEEDIDSDYECTGDITKLSMVLNNYVSNAVSHAAYDKIIRISSKDMDDKVRVSVFNTGDRISDVDIDKIWKSFYRADKSHSREEGRFGLGLSIVSAIQNLHGNDFGVENEENGVTFWFDITKKQG
ncbi:MAG: HAMP domain-containing histidine kinase [Clostridiales bacterium]|nr:HAMP domain-containing histidine kinase [Clostridiales bacterium]